MTYLWQKTDDDEDWVATELHQSVVIDDSTIHRAGETNRVRPGTGAVRIQNCGGHSGHWALLADPGLHTTVNGEPVVAGIRMLSDRDAIRVATRPVLYFSSETPPRAERYPGADGIFCPRCKRAVEREQVAVRCPRCRVWHHHSDTGESCWRYADTCALCDQPTDLDRAEFAWTPGDL